MLPPDQLIEQTINKEQKDAGEKENLKIYGTFTAKDFYLVCDKTGQVRAKMSALETAVKYSYNLLYSLAKEDISD